MRKVPQTEAIFETVQRRNREADAAAGPIRLSWDTKPLVPSGQLSRRTQPWITIWNPISNSRPLACLARRPAETWLSFTTGSTPADFLVDHLSELRPTLKNTVSGHIPAA